MEAIKNRYEIMALIEAKMCNPNGDPDAANQPRQDITTEEGIITDVAVKRWIRNYVDDAFEDQNIMVRKGTSMNKKIAEAVYAVNGLPEDAKNVQNKMVDETADFMARNYWDIRTFGGVLSTGLNAGQIKGAVQVAMSTSVDPVEQMQLSITRMAYADGTGKTLAELKKEEENRAEDKKRTMGDKQIIPYGLFPLKIAVSANIGQQVHFTEKDMDILLEAIYQMLDHNNSSSKMGMSLVSPVIVFKHVGTQPKENAAQNEREAKLGCAPAHKLFGLLHVKKKEGVAAPRDISDYDITFDTDKVPAGVIVGVKDSPYGAVDYSGQAMKEWLKEV